MTSYKIAALIGHADDFAMLESCVMHLRAVGIEAISVTADADVVGGDEQLRALAEQGDVRVVYHRQPNSETEYFLREAAMKTAEWAGADYVLFLDSDETPVALRPGVPRIPELGKADVITFRRLNALHSPDARIAETPEDLRQTLVVARPESVDLTDMSEDAPPWVLSPIMPRSMFARHVLKHLMFGAHTIVRDDVHVMKSDGLVFVHHAITNYERFERKVQRIHHILTEHPDKFKAGQARHWKRWFALYEAGRLRDEYARQILSVDRRAKLCDEGVVSTVAQLRPAPS